MSIFTRIWAGILSVISMLCFALDIPFYAVGDEVDMSKFTLTFSDEFDTELDRSVWSGHYTYGNTSEARKGSYWNQYLAETKNGNLVIPVTYLSEGIGGKGAGWYSAGIDTDSDAPNGFSQKYGYFECRCILPKGFGIWSAFWMMNEGVYQENGTGTDGTEIDIMESPYYGEFLENRVSANLHFDGYNDAHQKWGAKEFLLEGNPYEEFNTYAVEWNENEYIFYINGKEACRTDFGGVSQEPEYLILSVEMSGENGMPDSDVNIPDNGEGCEFIVDYVRTYQYTDKM